MFSLRRPGARILLPPVLLLGFAVLIGVLLHHVEQAHAAERSAVGAHTPVIVELFTSEGCSSCPPADALLARLQHDQPVASADVLALEEHVDYWDGLGWHDRFSSPNITARQSAYVRRFRLDSSYTPQMVVDGRTQLVGNDKAQAVKAIAQAARTPKLNLSVSALAVQNSHVTGKITLPASSGDAEVYAALVQPMASTQVLRGENGGHTLQHVSVVRALQYVPRSYNAANANFSLALPKDLTPADLRIVVFVQSKGQGPILAAATSTLSAGDEDAAVPEIN
jgi:hypothetical protein